MIIDSTAANSSIPATTPSASKNPLDKNAFLNLLTTQLQHQDPTQPQDDSAFLAQLAQFSSLEQLQQMNETLTSIAQFFKALQTTQTTATTQTTNEGTV